MRNLRMKRVVQNNVHIMRWSIDLIFLPKDYKYLDTLYTTYLCQPGFPVCVAVADRLRTYAWMALECVTFSSGVRAPASRPPSGFLQEKKMNANSVKHVPAR